MFLNPAKKVVVLIVEDEAVVRMLATHIIEDSGYEVLEASNADEAIELLETRLDIRVVFTDIDMPGSMDGLKLAMAIRNRWPPIELILTSGRKFIPDADLPIRGVFISKPYRAGAILAEIERMTA